jgi:hypothetical protein
MSLPYAMRVPLMYNPLASGAMEPGDALRVLVPDNIEFEIRRRMVVGYVCRRCLERGVDPAVCRSPEWEFDSGTVEAGIPPEVSEWAHRHAQIHRFEQEQRRAGR